MSEGETKQVQILCQDTAIGVQVVGSGQVSVGGDVKVNFEKHMHMEKCRVDRLAHEISKGADSVVAEVERSGKKVEKEVKRLFRRKF